MQTDAISLLPIDWREWLVGKGIVPVTTGMSGAAVFHVATGSATGHYLKIGTGAFAELVRREIERTQWLASVGVRVPEVTARLLKSDLAAALMTHLGSRTGEQIDAKGWQAPIRQIGRALARLHSVPTATCPFDETLHVRLARAEKAVRSGAIDPAHFDDRNRAVAPSALYDRLAARVPEREDRVVTHGDATLSNVIFGNDGQVGFVDCGNAGIADRYVDLALLVAGLEELFGPESRSVFTQGYGRLPWDAQKAEFYLDFYELF